MGELGTTTSELPTLSDSKILEILKKIESTDKIELVSTKIECGTVKGENYSGVLLACEITAKINNNNNNKDYHWFVKCPPSDPHRMASNRLMRIEEKEVTMYDKIIPKWRSMTRDKKIELNLCHAPYTEFDDKGSLIVMENLTKSGYRDPVDKRKGLSVDNAKLALAELGKFHALGYAYMKGHPGGVKEGLEKNATLANDFFLGNPDEKMKAMFETGKTETVVGWLDILEAVQEPGQDFAGVFKKFHDENDAVECRDKLYRPEEDEFNTLCHGDCWFNNMLFKENEKLCCLLDLAMIRWGNPCTDLAYFLFLSVTPQLRRTHLEEMLGHYHDSLVRCLSDLGEDPAVYPYRTLLKDYNKYSYGGFIMALWFLPMLLANKEDAMGQSDMEGDWTDEAKIKEFMQKYHEHMRIVMRKTPQVKIVMAGNFLEMVDRGIFKM